MTRFFQLVASWLQSEKTQSVDKEMANDMCKLLQKWRNTWHYIQCDAMQCNVMLCKQSRFQNLVSLDQRSKNESSVSNHFEIRKEITEFCPSGFTRSTSTAHVWNGCSQSSRFLPQARRIVGSGDENAMQGTVTHIMSACSKIVQFLYTLRHEKMLRPYYH